jgi:c-di-AMP phosphodiesterase-like protein
MACGLILNASWRITVLSMILITVGFLIYFMAFLMVYDIAMIVQVVIISLVICYSCYHFESILKNELIRQQQIEGMNKDLENVFQEMPNGILLIDSSNGEVKLANNAFCKLVGGSDSIEHNVLN